VGLEIQLVNSVEEREKGSKEIHVLQESLSKTAAELSDAQAKLANDKLKAEEEITSLGLELAATKEKAAQDAALDASEIKRLKVRCDVLWETISERRSPIITPLPAEDIGDKAEGSKCPVQPPLVPNSKPAEIPQDASSVMPPTLKGKGSGEFQEPNLVQSQSKTEGDIQKARLEKARLEKEKREKEKREKEKREKEKRRKQEVLEMKRAEMEKAEAEEKF